MTALAVAAVIAEEAALQTKTILVETLFAIFAADALAFLWRLLCRRVSRQILVEQRLSSNFPAAFTSEYLFVCLTRWRGIFYGRLLFAR